MTAISLLQNDCRYRVWWEVDFRKWGQRCRLELPSQNAFSGVFRPSPHVLHTFCSSDGSGSRQRPEAYSLEESDREEPWDTHLEGRWDRVAGEASKPQMSPEAFVRDESLGGAQPGRGRPSETAVGGKPCAHGAGNALLPTSHSLPPRASMALGSPAFPPIDASSLSLHTFRWAWSEVAQSTARCVVSALGRAAGNISGAWHEN